MGINVGLPCQSILARSFVDRLSPSIRSFGLFDKARHAGPVPLSGITGGRQARKQRIQRIELPIVAGLKRLNTTI